MLEKESHGEIELFSEFFQGYFQKFCENSLKDFFCKFFTGFFVGPFGSINLVSLHVYITKSLKFVTCRNMAQVDSLFPVRVVTVTCVIPGITVCLFLIKKKGKCD